MTSPSASPVDEVVYPGDVSREMLYELFVGAYLNVYRDEAGDVYVKERYTLWVFPQRDGEQIRLLAQFRANPAAERAAKLEYVNRINDQLKLIRAYVDADEDIGFDYFIQVEGGVTRRNIVICLRQFADYVRTSLDRDEGNVIN